jgi:UDP-glucose 4-epimerase
LVAILDLLEAMLRSHRRVLEFVRNLWHSRPMLENAPQRPITPYGRSKLAGEQILGPTRDLRFQFFY